VPLDRAVEKAAAIVERELDAGAEVSVAVAGHLLKAGSGDGHLHEALTLLALLESAPGAPAPEPDLMSSVIEARP
jgi:uncharacterized protein (DUF58 family)